jgi:hypothetical protein
MRFYHGTSVRGWLGILKSGSMDSKKIGDSRVSIIYSKFKGNYLTTNRKLAEMYANKIGKGVVIEIEYDPLAPGRKNNFKEQQAKGKDYFVEETPLQVDGPDCFIDTKDPLMTKTKMRQDINKTNEEIYMSENTERDLRNAWQKLDESMAQEARFSGFAGPNKGVELKKASDVKYFPKIPKSLKTVRTSPSGKIQQDPDILGMPGGEQLGENSPIDRNKIESIYEFGGQILDSAEAQGLTLDELQIEAANQRIVSALQGEGMRNPQNLDAIIDDAVYDSADVTRSAPAVPAGIFESIDRSLELLKQLKK